MNIINHPVEVNRVRIINQILDIVCLLANFHPNSLDFIRQLQRWIGGIDWWRWLVKCQFEKPFGSEWKSHPWTSAGASDSSCHTFGTNHWSIFLANWHLTSHLHQSIPPIHLCSCLMKSNEFGWKFASKQTISSIWLIILTLWFLDFYTMMWNVYEYFEWSKSIQVLGSSKYVLSKFTKHQLNSGYSSWIS